MTERERDELIEECVNAIRQRQEIEPLRNWNGLKAAMFALEDMLRATAAAPVSPAAPNRSVTTTGAEEVNAPESVAQNNGNREDVNMKSEPAAAELARLEQERDKWREACQGAITDRELAQAERDEACGLVARMHEAAMGEVCGPKRGVVEDIADLGAERDALQARVDTLCAWREDGDGVWHTSCGHQFWFDSGTPTENKQQFCGYCGSRLHAVTAPAGEEPTQ
jgi:hypothetical protein